MAKKSSHWVYGDTPPRSWRELGDILKENQTKSVKTKKAAKLPFLNKEQPQRPE